MPIIIRHALPDDIPAMASLLEQLFAIEADFVADGQVQINGLSLLLRTSALLLVADEDGSVVGMISIQPLISTAEGGAVGLLEDLVVHEECRGGESAPCYCTRPWTGHGSRAFPACSCWLTGAI